MSASCPNTSFMSLPFPYKTNNNLGLPSATDHKATPENNMKKATSCSGSEAKGGTTDKMERQLSPQQAISAGEEVEEQEEEELKDWDK